MNNGFVLKPENINLDTFNKRPAILQDHDYVSPVGKLEDIRFEENELSGLPNFFYPMAQTLFDIGVIVHAGIGGVIKATDDEGNITEFELLEVSI